MADSFEAIQELANNPDVHLGLTEEHLLEENWLTKDLATVNFKCRECGEVHQAELSRRIPDDHLRKHKMLCPCGKDTLYPCDYSGIEPRSTGMMVKITFEKNGRKAIRTQFANGKTTCRSQTKENHMIGKGTKSALTPRYQEEMNRQTEIKVRQKENDLKKQFQKMEHDRRKK